MLCCISWQASVLLKLWRTLLALHLLALYVFKRLAYPVPCKRCAQESDSGQACTITCTTTMELYCSFRSQQVAADSCQRVACRDGVDRLTSSIVPCSHHGQLRTLLLIEQEP